MGQDDDGKEAGARVFALVGAGGSGKTALAGALRTGASGAPEADPEEIRRGGTLMTRPMAVESGGFAFHLLDTPGDPGLLHEVERALYVADAALLVFPAARSARHNADRLVDLLVESGKPFACAVTRLAEEDSDVPGAIADLETRLKLSPLPLQLPMAAAAGRVMDLCELPGAIPEAWKIDAERSRNALVEIAAEADDGLMHQWMQDGTLDAPSIQAGLALATRHKRGVITPLLFAASQPRLGLEELAAWLRRLLPGPATRKGRDPAGAEVAIVPHPGAPVVLQVFRTTTDPYAGRLTFARVFAGTLEREAVLLEGRSRREERIPRILRTDGNSLNEIPRAGPGEIVVLPKLKEARTGDTLADRGRPVVMNDASVTNRPAAAAIRSQSPEEKVSLALHRAVEEDPALAFIPSAERTEMLLWGTSDTHLEITAERVLRKHRVDLELAPPHPAYRETIRATASGHGRYKRQTGGHGQFADCTIEIRPLPRGAGVTFEDAVFGGSIPRQFIPSVEKGVRNAMNSGPMGGLPVVDVHVTLQEGQFHSVDSSDMAFQIAGSLAFKDAAQRAGSILLEPVMSLELIVPEEMLGAVITDLHGRRARVQGMDPQPRGVRITALCPQAELLRYGGELRSLTQGAGVYRVKPSHWEPAPAPIAQRILTETRPVP